MGMTDSQFKTVLLDQLADLQRILDLAIKAGNADIQNEVEKQIKKVNQKLEF